MSYAKQLRKTITTYYAPVKDPVAYWEKQLGDAPASEEQDQGDSGAEKHAGAEAEEAEGSEAAD